MILNKGGRDNYRNTTRDGGEDVKSVCISLTDILKNVNLQLCHQDRAGVLLPLGQERCQWPPPVTGQMGQLPKVLCPHVRIAVAESKVRSRERPHI